MDKVPELESVLEEVRTFFIDILKDADISVKADAAGAVRFPIIVAVKQKKIKLDKQTTALLKEMMSFVHTPLDITCVASQDVDGDVEKLIPMYTELMGTINARFDYQLAMVDAKIKYVKQKLDEYDHEQQFHDWRASCDASQTVQHFGKVLSLIHI